MGIGKKIKKVIILSTSVIFFIFLLNLLVYFEREEPGASIKKLDDAFWYTIVTLTTVGYGDMYPISFYGKFIGYFFVICSLGFLGFLISKLTALFINFKERKKMGLFGSKFTNHILVIGWDDFARAIVDQLVNAGNRVSIVTTIKNHVDLIHESYSEKQVHVLFTDTHKYENLKKANIESASIIFINLENDTEKLVYLLNLKKAFGSLKFLVTLDNANLKDTFTSAGVDFILSKNEVAAKLVASYIFEPDVARFSEDLLSSSKSEKDFDFQQYRVTPKNPFFSDSYGNAFIKIKRDYNCILIGLSKKRDDHYELLKNPPDGMVIENDDYLILITNGRAEKQLKESFGISEGVLNS